VNACLAYDAARPLRFDDVPSTDPAAKFINLLKNTFIVASGDYIFSGVGNHSTGTPPTQSNIWHFQPQKEATRLDVVKTALVSNCIPILDYIPRGGVTFTDVPAKRSPDDEAQDFTSRVFYTAALHGIVTGFPDGSARPYQKATLLETLTILLRTANAVPADYSPIPFVFDDLPYSKDAWYAAPVSFAVKNGILGNVEAHLAPHAPVRRDALASLLGRIMRYSSDIQVRSYRDSVESLVK
jgi:hypothetical protein